MVWAASGPTGWTGAFSPSCSSPFLASLDFDPFQNALKLAKKKHIGPFRDKDKADFYQKDLAVLARAGFDYEVAKKVMDFEPES